MVNTRRLIFPSSLFLSFSLSPSVFLFASTSILSRSVLLFCISNIFGARFWPSTSPCLYLRSTQARSHAFTDICTKRVRLRKKIYLAAFFSTTEEKGREKGVSVSLYHLPTIFFEQQGKERKKLYCSIDDH